MKKLFYIALMLVCGFTTSCDVLDTEPKDSYNELLIWRNKDLAENVLKEAYWSILKNMYCSGDNNTECLRTEAWSDNVWNKDNNSVAAEAISPTNIENYVGGFNKYGYIRKASLIIDKLTDNSDIDAASCKQFIAEARCLRVMVYDWMVRRWGGVMLVDKLMTPKDEMKLPRTSEADMYKYMVEQLKLAIPDLPETSVKERFSKGAALTLLTRVSLEGGLYDETIAAGKQLFEGAEASRWSLDPDYRKMFGSYKYPEESPEIQFYFTQGEKKQYCENLLPMYIVGTMAPGRNIMGSAFNEKVDAWCQTWPSQELADAYLAIDVDGDGQAKPYTETAKWQNAPVKTAAIMYSNRDKRFDATICHDGSVYFTSPIEMHTKGNCYWENTQNHGFMTQSGYMWRKFIYECDGTLPGYQIPYDFRYILLRLGEASLNYAEALGRKGKIKEAVEVMNMTRTKHGGLPALANTVSADEFWKNYKIERRCELALEGDRYFSVIRWAKVENAETVPEFNKRTHCIVIDGDDGTFELIDTSHGSSTGSDRVFSWPKRMYFPLPENQTMNNENLSQNKYW